MLLSSMEAKQRLGNTVETSSSYGGFCIYKSRVYMMWFCLIQIHRPLVTQIDPGMKMSEDCSAHELGLRIFQFPLSKCPSSCLVRCGCSGGFWFKGLTPCGALVIAIIVTEAISTFERSCGWMVIYIDRDQELYAFRCFHGFHYSMGGFPQVEWTALEH